MRLRFPVLDTHQSRLHAYPSGMWVCFELIDKTGGDPSDTDSQTSQSSDPDGFGGFGQASGQVVASRQSPGSLQGRSLAGSPGSQNGDEADEGEDVMADQFDVEGDVSKDPKAFQKRKFCRRDHTLLERQYP